MKRTTVTLSDDVALAVQREARRRRVSVSEVIRQVLALGLGISRDDRRALPFAAIGRSGHRHTARDLEDILRAEWERAGDR
jgi:Arc/MetJ-type ribon-helix-helix transcriptional regulator